MIDSAILTLILYQNVWLSYALYIRIICNNAFAAVPRTIFTYRASQVLNNSCSRIPTAFKADSDWKSRKSRKTGKDGETSSQGGGSKRLKIGGRGSKLQGRPFSNKDVQGFSKSVSQIEITRFYTTCTVVRAVNVSNMTHSCILSTCRSCIGNK